MNSIYDIARRSRAPIQTGVKPVTNQGSYRTPSGIAQPPQQQREDTGASAAKLGGLLGKAYKNWRKLDEAKQAEEAWGKTLWQQNQPGAATRFGQQQLRDYLNGEGAPAGTPGYADPNAPLPQPGGVEAAGLVPENPLANTELGQTLGDTAASAGNAAGNAAGNTAALGDAAALSSAPGQGMDLTGGLLARFQSSPEALAGISPMQVPEIANPLAGAASGASDAAGAASSLPGVGQVLGAGSAAMNLANGDYLNAGLDAAKVALLSAGPYGALGSLGIQAGQTLGDLTGWW